MILKCKIFIIFFILIFSCTKSFATENKILFKVNNEIITTYDILKEIKYLKLLNIEFKNFSENKIYDVAKNSIIKQKIKENKLKTFYKKIELEDSFLKKFLLNYFSKLNLSSIAEVNELLNKNDLKLDYIKKKITIQLMWNEFIFKKFSKSIKINKQLIKQEISKKKIQKEFLISEIVFNANSKSELNRKLNLIKKEINKSNFISAAIIYSESDSSINGGKIGWVKESSLSDQIKNKIKNIEVGETTNPIQIPGAFIILKVEDIRKTSLKFDTNKEIEMIIKRKTNEQLNQFSNIYLNKIKKNVRIDEL